MKSVMQFAATAILAMAILLDGESAHAQSPAFAGAVSVAVMYNASQSRVTTANNFWMQGGSVELTATAWHGLGATAKITGLTCGNIGQGVPLNLVTTTFGPRYTWSRQTASGHGIAIFGQGLLGIANGFRSLFPAEDEATSSSNGMALEAGGGVDLGLRPHLSLRLIEAGWLRTQLPNSTTNVQNNLLLGAGIVFHTR